MRAMVLSEIVSLQECSTPLQLQDLPRPRPAGNEVLVKILACGVCHTELDEIEGRTPPPRLPVVPGHEIVGVVSGLGEKVSRLEIGMRVGVGWIHHSDGSENENTSPAFCACGRDVNGGYAEYMTVPEDYAYPIPSNFSDAEAAPLLCAGAIGYRALRIASIVDGETLGLTGFGGSAHLVLQLARHLYPQTRVFVFARDAQTRLFAKQQGADWVGDTSEQAPEPLHAIIDTTPAWLPVLKAMNNLRASGRLVINAIRKEDHDKKVLAELSYHEHLWMEKEIKSVANITAGDIREFLDIAAAIPIRPEIQTYPLEDANQAIMELRDNTVKGAKVLLM